MILRKENVEPHKTFNWRPSSTDLQPRLIRDPKSLDQTTQQAHVLESSENWSTTAITSVRGHQRVHEILFWRLFLL